ncbi:hypothetical protein FGO68_gene5279 [Halteria grandinella]|uniref:peptidylprolyl isomerase n=1 Tax=Halteria grandinella TaxID=5974 RepID=A0A8J8NY06_HALGN|nr:hypothetical protein FGO68_gene5279 [Halteria grandinella]
MEQFVETQEEQELVDLFDKEVDQSDKSALKKQLLYKRLIVQDDQNPHQSKKRAALDHHYLSQLPSADMYERSYQHREILTHVMVSHRHDFLITLSADGYLKFWKKVQQSLEFVKTFRAHPGAASGVAISQQENRMATVSQSDQSLKIFDLTSFDLIHFVKLKFPTIGLVEFVSKPSAFTHVVALTSKNVIYLFRPESTDAPFRILKDLHFSNITCLKYVPVLNIAVSTDVSGLTEVWDSESGEFPGGLGYEFMSDTGFMELPKAKTHAIAMAVREEIVAMYCRDRKVRVFNVKSGKIIITIDESLTQYAQSEKGSMQYLEKFDLERRLAVERDLEKQWDVNESTIPSIGFDESGTYLYYGSPVGIKIVSLRSGLVERLVGKVESTERFLQIALYQGKPQKSTSQAKSAVGYGGKSSSSAIDIDPTFLCTAYKNNRFYLFTQREPIDPDENKQSALIAATAGESLGRDVFNEKAAVEGSSDIVGKSIAKSAPAKGLPTQAIMYTSMGEVHFELFPNDCPKTVENFVGLAKKGYYEGCIFHRVIRTFMIQTGDPQGDGTGGTSIWNEEFEDEIRPHLKHEAFVLAMANAGPNTNGSQFFITTVACPWLDGKHTVFGRVTRGSEVVSQIESVRVDDKKKPLMDVKISQVKVIESDVKK